MLDSSRLRKEKKKNVSRLYLNEASRQRVAAASSRVILGVQDNFTNKNDLQKKKCYTRCRVMTLCCHVNLITDQSQRLIDGKPAVRGVRTVSGI